MRIRSKITAVIAAASLAGLGFIVIPATGALAQSCPVNSGCPTQGITAQVSIPLSLSMAVTQNNSQFTNAGTFTPGQQSPAYQITIGDNDIAGYIVDEQGPTDGDSNSLSPDPNGGASFTSGSGANETYLADTSVDMGVDPVGITSGNTECNEVSAPLTGTATPIITYPYIFNGSPTTSGISGDMPTDSYFGCGASAGSNDVWNVLGWTANPPASTPQGIYSGTITLTAWAQ